MSWFTGTADHYKDLLNDLRTAAVTTTTFWDEGVAIDGDQVDLPGGEPVVLLEDSVSGGLAKIPSGEGLASGTK